MVILGQKTSGGLAPLALDDQGRLLVVVESSGGGDVDFASITGAPTDNAALAAALTANDGTISYLAENAATWPMLAHVYRTPPTTPAPSAGDWGAFSLDPNNATNASYSVLGRWFGETNPTTYPGKWMIQVLGAVYGKKASADTWDGGTPLIYDFDSGKFVLGYGFTQDLVVFAATPAVAGSAYCQVLLTGKPGRVCQGAYPT